jgi:hypothetical protein
MPLAIVRGKHIDFRIGLSRIPKPNLRWEHAKPWGVHAAAEIGLVPPVIDFAVNLRIDSSVTTEILRDRETNCCEKVCGEA